MLRVPSRERYAAVAALAVLLVAAGIVYGAARSGLTPENSTPARMFRSIGSVLGNSETGSGEEAGSATTPSSGRSLRQVAAILATPRPFAKPAPATTNIPGSGRLAGRVICIDPGHAANTNAGTEPIGPGSSEMKTTEPGGTTGVVSGVPEYQITMAIARQLKPILEAEGAKVVMVRDGDIFNGLARDRTLIANQAGADLYLRIHCDGSENQSASGASTIYPASIQGWTDDIAPASKKAAQAVQAAMVTGLGVPDLGIVERGDLLGFNWSDVPAVLAETGFLTNPAEDARLTSPDYQQSVARALAAGVIGYFG